jgi:hypothetical protein
MLYLGGRHQRVNEVIKIKVLSYKSAQNPRYARCIINVVQMYKYEYVKKVELKNQLIY